MNDNEVRMWRNSNQYEDAWRVCRSCYMAKLMPLSVEHILAYGFFDGFMAGVEARGWNASNAEVERKGNA